MKRLQFKSVVTLATALLVLNTASVAFAQYVWTDEKGVKQYSDMPPPPSVPANRILKQPRGAPSATSPSNAEEVAAAAAPSSPQPAMSIAEKNAEFRKRKAEQAENEKKAADEARLAAEKSKNCERARDYLRALESGERISRTDRNGERSFLTDEQREKEAREARKAAQDCK